MADCDKIVIISTHALTWRATPGCSCSACCSVISTHALTWRATPLLSHCFCNSGISTHALTWRATYLLNKIIYAMLYFYPRPHMEGDNLVDMKTKMREYFYPRPHMEGDAIALLLEIDPELISTHALTWRATSQSVSRALSFWNFYPRPHMEGDCSTSRAGIWRRRFLPTPSHGGRHQDVR